jgi:GDP-mannose 6-dehydrogenase
MNLLCKDTKLNVSPRYLAPGNPFGGSCLPKDVQALVRCGRDGKVETPMIGSLLQSNEAHFRSLIETVKKSQQREIIIVGLSFKAKTDDLRGSPMVDVARTLLSSGYQLRIYDPSLKLALLVGSNKRVVETKLPNLGELLHQDLKTALGKEGLVIAAQQCVPLEQLAKSLTSAHQILDVNGWPELKSLPIKYEGFCW